MSAIAAAVGPPPPVAPSVRVRSMLGAMGIPGDDAADVASPVGFSVALGASAHEWERALRPGAGTVAEHGPITVAADATLYHRDDLRRALGLAPHGIIPDPLLIARAYEAWDVAGLARLEGDFAFVLWDAARARLVAARSFAGQRTLYHARTGDGLRVATSVSGLLADDSVPRDIDLAAVATAAAGLWGHSPRTAYRAIDELAAGQALVWERERGARVSTFWFPEETILTRRESLDAAAEELRALLIDAVRERLSPTGATAISLSGGWDSTSVGGAATVALAGATRDRLRPVSISYPEGDAGREDDFIRDVVAHWGIATRWIPVDDITLLPDLAGGAAARDLPFAHAYEHWNRALSRAARREDARVILDGVGGDQLFQISDILLSDLFGRGRWIELARQWRARGGRGLGNAWRWAVRPALPPSIPGFLAKIRGMPAPRDHLHRQAPWWMSRRFLEQEDVLARDDAAQPQLPRGSRVLAETHAYLRYPFFGRILGALHQFALEEGVELRSPLLDDRVVRFAVRRPWSERSDGRETKIVLRRAMRGLLPDHVLAPRARRTGTTSAYFLRQLRGPARPFIESALQDPILASLGMIDATRLRHAWTHVLQHDDDDAGARIFFTLQAELWTRAHLTGP